MAKRLTVPRQPTEESHILPGIPAPATLPGGRSAFARALAVALRSAGGRQHGADHRGPDYLAGLTGCAFGLPVGEDFSLAALRELPRERVTEALGILGRRAEWRSFAGEGTQLVECLKAALVANGCPVPILGWPEASDDWGLITGFDLGRGVICGWPAGYSREANLAAPPRGETALLLADERGAHWDLEALEDEYIEGLALAWAADQAEVLSRGYALWREMLADRSLWREDDEAAQARVLRQEQATEALTEARMTAAVFVEDCRASAPGARDEFLGSALECYERQIEALEARTRPFGSDAITTLLSREWRREWRERLSTIEALDLGALSWIHKALADDDALWFEDDREETP